MKRLDESHVTSSRQIVKFCNKVLIELSEGLHSQSVGELVGALFIQIMGIHSYVHKHLSSWNLM